MPVDYVALVAEKCNDYEGVGSANNYSILPATVYSNSITSALYLYQKMKPRTNSFIVRLVAQSYVEIPTTLNPAFDAKSKIEQIEFISRDPNQVDIYKMQLMQSLVRKDVYGVEYAPDINKWVIKFVGKVTGTFRVVYSYPVNDISLFDDDEIEGMLYWAASDACKKIAAKFARVFTSKIPADVQAYRDKVEYYRSLAKDYWEIGCNILDVNEKTGSMGYASIASWGTRRFRRII